MSGYQVQAVVVRLSDGTSVEILPSGGTICRSGQLPEQMQGELREAVAAVTEALQASGLGLAKPTTRRCSR